MPTLQFAIAEDADTCHARGLPRSVGCDEESSRNACARAPLHSRKASVLTGFVDFVLFLTQVTSSLEVTEFFDFVIDRSLDVTNETVAVL